MRDDPRGPLDSGLRVYRIRCRGREPADIESAAEALTCGNATPANRLLTRYGVKSLSSSMSNGPVT